MGAAGEPNSSSHGGRGFSMTAERYPEAGGFHDGARTGHRSRSVVRRTARG